MIVHHLLCNAVCFVSIYDFESAFCVQFDEFWFIFVYIYLGCPFIKSTMSSLDITGEGPTLVQLQCVTVCGDSGVVWFIQWFYYFKTFEFFDDKMNDIECAGCAVARWVPQIPFSIEMLNLLIVPFLSRYPVQCLVIFVYGPRGCLYCFQIVLEYAWFRIY